MNRHNKNTFSIMLLAVLILKCNLLAADTFLTKETADFIREKFEPASLAEIKSLQQGLIGTWYNQRNRYVNFFEDQYIFSGVSGVNEYFSSRVKEMLVFPPKFPTPAPYEFVVSAALPANEQTLLLLDAQLDKLKAQNDQLTKKKFEMQETLRKMSIEEQKRENPKLVALQEQGKPYGDDMNKLRTMRAVIQESMNDGESTLYLASLKMTFFFNPKIKNGTREIIMVDELKEKQSFDVDVLMNSGRFYVTSTSFDKDGKYQPVSNPPTNLDIGITAGVERDYKTALTIWERKCQLLQENKGKLSGSTVLQECNDIVGILSEQLGDSKSLTSPTQPVSSVPVQSSAFEESTKSIVKEKPTTTKPFELSDYAHFQVVPVDPNAPIEQGIKDMWAKGFYVHLKSGGNLGFNTDAPGPYAYLPVNRWEKKNGVLTITLGDINYPFDLPTEHSNDNTKLMTIDSTHKAFRMTYTMKREGQL